MSVQRSGNQVFLGALLKLSRNYVFVMRKTINPIKISNKLQILEICDKIKSFSI